MAQTKIYLDSGGRAAIPKKIRDMLGADDRSAFKVSIEQGCIVLMPVALLISNARQSALERLAQNGAVKGASGDAEE